MSNRDWDNRWGGGDSRWSEDRDRGRYDESREGNRGERSWRDDGATFRGDDRNFRGDDRNFRGEERFRPDEGRRTEHGRSFGWGGGFRDDASREFGGDRGYRGEVPRDLGYRADRQQSGIGDEWANRGLDRDFGRQGGYGRSFGGGDLGRDRDDHARWGRDEPRGGFVQHLADRGREMGRDIRGESDRGQGLYPRSDWDDRNAGFDRSRSFGGGRGPFTSALSGGSYGRDDGHGFAMGGEEHRGLWSRMKDKMTGRPPRNYQRSDERIREDLYDRLLQSWIDAEDVNIQVKAGDVTLSGTVPTREEKRALEDMAEGILGVRDVHNQVRVNRGQQGMGTGSHLVDHGRVSQPTQTGGTASAQGAATGTGVGDGTSVAGVTGQSGTTTPVLAGKPGRS